MSNPHPEPHPENLIPFRKGVSGNPKGRQKKLVNAIKSVPPDAQEKIYSVLLYSLTLPDEASARAYLQCRQGELGQYGIVLQIAIRHLTKEGFGLAAMMDILDRVYGRPKISADLAHMGGITLNIQTDEETRGMIEGGLG